MRKLLFAIALTGSVLIPLGGCTSKEVEVEMTPSMGKAAEKYFKQREMIDKMDAARQEAATERQGGTTQE